MKKLILVVENDEGTKDILKKLFETKNINIVSIDNSNDVMNFLKTVKPDCILAGNYFPNSISGIELGLKLKETNIPFILFSGYQDIVKKARKEGIVCFQKPYVKSFVHFVTELLKKG